MAELVKSERTEVVDGVDVPVLSWTFGDATVFIRRHPRNPFWTTHVVNPDGTSKQVERLRPRDKAKRMAELWLVRITGDA